MAEKPKLKRNTTSAEVARILRWRILNGDFAEGEFIRQEAIATELEVSRIPVREALAILETEGFVIHEKYKGAVVPKLSIEEIQEVYALRRMIESFLLREACPHIDEETLQEAYDLIEQSSDCENLEVWAELNWAFHRTLYTKANLPLTLQVLESLSRRADRYLRIQRSLLSTTMRIESDKQHAELLKLIENEQYDQVVDALLEHIAWNEADMYAALTRETHVET